ncbi:unnamed protein product [Commensalibacter communis]|nr:unnamed protein product [Commensalibacter communis]
MTNDSRHYESKKGTKKCLIILKNLTVNIIKIVTVVQIVIAKLNKFVTLHAVAERSRLF